MLARKARWRLVVALLTLAAVAVRLLIIAHSRGGSDLRIYVYFSRLALHGINPFAPPTHGLFPPVLDNSPPVEVAFCAGLLKLHDSPTTLRLAFVVADALVLLVIGLWFPRTRRWRLGLMLFYGFNPYVLIAFTAFSEDKTILFLGIVCWLLAIELRWEWGSWISAAALTVFKFLGLFAAPALAVDCWRRRGIRALVPIGVVAAIVAFGALPWLPQSLDAFTRRDQRLGITPIHASPTLLLARLHVYAPIEARLAPGLAILAVLAWFVYGRLDLRETVVWSIFAGYIALPDDPFSRILLVALPFLLLIDLTWRRWIVIWVVTCAEAVAAWIAAKGVPRGLSSLAGPLRDMFPHESTVGHVLWINLLVVVVIAFYVLDRPGRATARLRTALRGHAWSRPRRRPSFGSTARPTAG